MAGLSDVEKSAVSHTQPVDLHGVDLHDDGGYALDASYLGVTSTLKTTRDGRTVLYAFQLPVLSKRL